ncbi:MAG: AAA family ATPase, partial [Lachnospiraceae bacterium]|nr:AAA family ATPase [Lachnospiraceae bacterium]
MDPLHIVSQCYEHLPGHMKAKPWDYTEHGRKVLQTENELNAYIAAYGEMHILKCRAALQNFPFDNLNMYSYEIFDWGCGQGLATLTLLDMLQDRGKLSRLQRIYLIEPSRPALIRATNWVKHNVGPGIDVVAINKYIPNDSNTLMPDVSCSSRISINLFSNILDIRSLSLYWLANKTSSLANTNYMICVGPKFSKNYNTRIIDFCGYFKPKEYFSNIEAFPYSFTTSTHHAFGCETKCFIHKKENKLNDNYQEIASDYEVNDIYDYAAELLTGSVDERIINFYNRLRLACESSYKVFFRPTINCDVVDFVLTSISHGIMLINVCENIDDIAEASNRIENVKSNLFNVHLKNIKIDSVINTSVYNCVKTALYFPNNSIEEIKETIEKIKQGNNDKKLDYLFIFTESSNLANELNSIKALGFRCDYNDEIIRLISSKWHSYKDGDPNVVLSTRQQKIVRSYNNRLRVKGVAGCGKTQVVANRAVEQHIKTGERVLIITFNITLIQYIRMRINQVPADFSPNMFEIINYHQFFKSKANQYSNKSIQIEDFDNSKFFEPYSDKIKKYKTIIIDEVQDFKESWLYSIITYFLSDGGTVSLFGDGEQNIYGRALEVETKMPPINNCGFSGRWNEMSERISMRILNPEISSLCSDFLKSFMDNLSVINIDNTFMFERYYVNYWNLKESTSPDTLASNIRWIISEYKLNIGEVVVLAESIKLLRDIEASYVDSTKLGTMINF